MSRLTVDPEETITLRVEVIYVEPGPSTRDPEWIWLSYDLVDGERGSGGRYKLLDGGRGRGLAGVLMSAIKPPRPIGSGLVRIEATRADYRELRHVSAEELNATRDVGNLLTMYAAAIATGLSRRYRLPGPVFVMYRGADYQGMTQAFATATRFILDGPRDPREGGTHKVVAYGRERKLTIGFDEALRPSRELVDIIEGRA